jgi:hypothetical protein
MAEAPPSTQPSLRAEHDDLARRLESRPSVDLARGGFARGFAGILSLGLGGALLWDRYDKLDLSDPGPSHPAPYLSGAGVAAALGVFLVARGVVVLLRSRRMAREEAALFARLLELRRLLEIDA